MWHGGRKCAGESGIAAFTRTLLPALPLCALLCWERSDPVDCFWGNTEYRIQNTEGRRQKSEGRSQKSEDRRQETGVYESDG